MNKHITKIGKTALVVTLMTTILTQGSSSLTMSMLRQVK